MLILLYALCFISDLMPVKRCRKDLKNLGYIEKRKITLWWCQCAGKITITPAYVEDFSQCWSAQKSFLPPLVKNYFRV